MRLDNRLEKTVVKKLKTVAEKAEAALLEMAADFRGTGLMSEATYQKILSHDASRSDMGGVTTLRRDATKAD